MTQKFDTSWDVEKYHTDYESEEHWELKCNFINAHKDRFPEEELICLAQVFFNVEFMGCRYPLETMQLVAELSKEVAADFRKSRKGRLQRTFVTANQAIEAKYKDKLKDTNTTTTFQSKKGIAFVRASLTEDSTSTNKRKIDESDDEVSEVIPSKKAAIASSSSAGPNDGVLRAKFSKFIIYENDPIASTTLACSAAKNKYNLRVDCAPKQFKVFLNEEFLGEGETRVEASERAINSLKRFCYTIHVKNKYFSNSETIGKAESNNVDDSGTSDPSECRIDSNNVGFKLLKSLGWSGGSLGSNNTGILDPIKAEIKIGRSGLGAADSTIDDKRIRKLLLDYKTSNDLCDLVFSQEFGKEERAMIHKTALKMQLKSQSFGKNETRHVVISRYKNISELLGLLMHSGDPGLLQKYEVIPPLLK